MAVQLLEIEKELSGPNREAAMRQYDAVLKGLDDRLGRALAEGMAPEDFGRAEALRHAVLLARKLLRLTVQSE